MGMVIGGLRLIARYLVLMKMRYSIIFFWRFDTFFWALHMKSFLAGYDMARYGRLGRY
jgi:hypothetical protein